MRIIAVKKFRYSNTLSALAMVVPGRNIDNPVEVRCLSQILQVSPWLVSLTDIWRSTISIDYSN